MSLEIIKYIYTYIYTIHVHNMYTGRPEMRQLQEVMRIDNIDIKTKWCELGQVLLGSDNILAVIKANHSTDVTACCSEMFKIWLERTPDANWNQLVTALRNIKLYTAADAVIKYCKSGSQFLYLFYYAINTH